MLDGFVRWSFKVVFFVFVVALAVSLYCGLSMLWNPDEITPKSHLVVSTSLIFVVASLFYTGLCDAWFRITARPERKK